MIYLILDTNIWVYLANGLDPTTAKHHDHQHFDLLKSLKELKENGDITLLVSEIVINEWNRNKHHCQTKVETLKKKLLSQNDAFGGISKYTTSSLDQLKEEYIEGVKKDIDKNEKHIINVEEFLLNACTKIDISNETKLKVFALATDNKAPFHNTKNNVADAAILFSAAEYLKDILYGQDSSAIFVSNNFTDFTDGKTKDKFHQDIVSQLNSSQIKYQQILPAALKLSKEILVEIEEFYKQELWLESISFICRTEWCESFENIPISSYLDKEIVVKTQYEFELDPSQLTMFPNEKASVLKYKNSRMGDCTICGTLHIECPDCNNLIDVNDPHQEFECVDCKVIFKIKQENEANCLVVFNQD